MLISHPILILLWVIAAAAKEEGDCSLVLMIAAEHIRQNLTTNSKVGWAAAKVSTWESGRGGDPLEFVQHFLPPAQSTSYVRSCISKCSTIVELETNSQGLVAKMVDTITSSRVKASLSVTTSSKSVKRLMGKLASDKPTFDINLIFYSRQGILEERRSYAATESSSWKQLEVLYLVMPPFVVPTPAGLAGVDGVIWAEIIRRMDLQASFRKVKSYTQLTDEIVNRTADVGIGSISHNVERYSRGVDLSKPISPNAIYFACHKPVPVDQILSTIAPFSRSMWFTLLASMVLMGLTLLLINQLTFRGVKFHLVSVTCVALINECLPDFYLRIRKTTLAAFIVLFIWITIASFISHAYRSILLSRLVLVEQEAPINTFQDLLDNDIVLPIYKGTIITPLMEKSTSPSIKQVFNQAVETGALYSGKTPEWITARDPKTVAQFTTSVFIVGRRHLLRTGKEGLPTAYTGHYYVMKHPMQGRFDSIIGRMQDSGVVKGLLDRYLWLKAKGERDHARNHPDSGTPMPLGMRHALSMMLALWVGLGAGLLAFICELAFRARGGETRMQNRRRSNRRVRMIQLVM